VSEDPELILSQIGLRISRRRKDLGLTQKALADSVGMQAANVYRIEYGDQNVTIRTLCKIAEALDMTVAELVAEQHDDRSA
jgi:transcriptional regulator with XRE-family HTH domain